MKLNKTQREVLRHIFGCDDGTMVIRRGSPMPIIRGSREHTFAKELASHGLAELFVRNGYLYIARPHHLRDTGETPTSQSA